MDSLCLIEPSIPVLWCLLQSNTFQTQPCRIFERSCYIATEHVFMCAGPAVNASRTSSAADCTKIQGVQTKKTKKKLYPVRLQIACTSGYAYVCACLINPGSLPRLPLDIKSRIRPQTDFGNLDVDKTQVNAQTYLSRCF